MRFAQHTSAVVKAWTLATMLAASAHAGVAHADTKHMEGNYTLPMPNGLGDLSSYPMTNARWTEEDGRVMFVYEMPEDLTGESHYQMIMVADATQADSDEFFPMVCNRTGSTATCAKQGDGITCTIRFRNLGIDKTKVDAFLDTKYGVSAATDRRKAAAQVVQGDAVGALGMQPVHDGP